MKLYKSLKEAEKERANVNALKISVKDKKFPEMLHHFENLEELYMEGLCEEFPKMMPSWPNLKTLSIKWSNFTGDLSALFSLPKLSNLKIIETPLKTFLLPLGHASAPLRSLTIKDCQFKTLPEEISMLTELEELNLSGNKLESLPVGFKALTKLRRLNLDGNCFKTFPDFIKTLPKLTHLSIDNNQFPEEEKERIQREFHIWPN